MLGLQAEGCPEVILRTALEGLGSFHEVAAVELDARLICEDFHDYTRLVAPYPGCQPGQGVRTPVKDKVMVIPFAMQELWMVLSNPLPNGSRCRKI